MPDTALSLWQELFEKMDDDSFYATEIQGGLYCWFCGVPSPSRGNQRHEIDCIWVRAKALIAAPL